MLGFNPANLRVLRADPGHRLQPAAIDAALHIDREAGLTPFCVVGTAGTTSTGAVDPLNDLADLAAARACGSTSTARTARPPGSRSRRLLAGIERADRLVLDPHKWLFQPYEIGAVLVRHPGLLEHAFALDGAYLRDTDSGIVELRERGPQLTRGARALKLWLSLRVFGLDAFRAAIARSIALAEHAEATLERAEAGRSSRPRRWRWSASGARATTTTRRTRWCVPRSPTATPRRARRSSTDAPSHGCARSIRARRRRTSSAPSTGWSALALRHLNTRDVAALCQIWDVRRWVEEEGRRELVIA